MGTPTVLANGDQCWCVGEMLHREDGPAVIYVDGKRHRESGPAVIETNPIKYIWYINNVKVSETDYMISKVKAVIFYSKPITHLNE